MKNNQQTIRIPLRPKNACYFLVQDENELTIRTNFWKFGRVWVSTFFLFFTYLVCSACYKKLLKLWDAPDSLDYVWFFLTVVFGLYILGVTAKMLFERIFVVLNSEGLWYQYRLLFYSSRRHIPLGDIRGFECFVKQYDQKHTGYFVKTVTDEDDLLIHCDNGEYLGWLEAEMNYMLAYLLEKEKGETMPPFRTTCVINGVKYRFRSEENGDQLAHQ